MAGRRIPGVVAITKASDAQFWKIFAVAESPNIGDSASRYPRSGMKTAESFKERFCRGGILVY